MSLISRTTITRAAVGAAALMIAAAPAFAREAESGDDHGHHRGAQIATSKGADDAAGHVRHGRGRDDAAGHVRRARGADDAPGHVRHAGGAGDGPNPA